MKNQYLAFIVVLFGFFSIAPASFGIQYIPGGVLLDEEDQKHVRTAVRQLCDGCIMQALIDGNISDVVRRASQLDRRVQNWNCDASDEIAVRQYLYSLSGEALLGLRSSI